MNLEARIENLERENQEMRQALITAGLLIPSPLPDAHMVREALARGDNGPLHEYMKAAKRQGRLIEALEAAGILGKPRNARRKQS